ncbi:MAG: hypothetical protein JXA66_06870 [Oligoflexia bacterium]|nr:hypothetical protein [Oligoflexia bacterium]
MKRHSNGIDPLYVIFEKHLYDYPYDSTDDFIFAVVREYMDYMRQENLILPDSSKDQITDVLTEEVREMLLKKIYGCLSIKDYVKEITPRKEEERIQARERYSILKKLA